jgi:hypothetical protein
MIEDFYIFLEVVAFLFIVGKYLHNYAEEEIEKHILFFVYLTWAICFSVVIILPLDIYYVLLIY